MSTRYFPNRKLFFLPLLYIVACGGSFKKPYDHTYPKYWEKYTEQQLADSLYADTLAIAAGEDGDRESRAFYINTTKQLISDLHDDREKNDSLFPGKPFDEVVLVQSFVKSSIVFKEAEVTRLLEIINDPVSFDWGETTYEKEYDLEFRKDNDIVAVISVGANESVFMVGKGWPAFKKFKFGQLKDRQRDKWIKLVNDVVDQWIITPNETTKAQ